MKDEQTKSATTKIYYSGDPSHLQNYDHPGMSLVSIILTGTNYNSRLELLE